MMHSAEQSRRQLEAGFEQGFQFPFLPQTSLTPTAPARDSAVLVLFGALDRVPAAEASDAVSAVGPSLDVLLTRRSNGLRNHAGQIAFPGGGVEPGDADYAATALREASEETGLDPTGVDVLGLLPSAHIPVSNYLVNPVLGWWRLPSEVAADHSESIEVFRVPVAELVDPAARVTSVLRAGSSVFTGPAFQLGPQFGGHLVWGFTAMLLAGVFDTVGWSVPWDKNRTRELS
jgi:8-oxo-dGTP pyrophosphatase MutT (NUDIX family)